jgi:hypothetical protein
VIYGEVFLGKSRDVPDGRNLVYCGSRILNIGHQSGAGLNHICTMSPALIAFFGV